MTLVVVQIVVDSLVSPVSKSTWGTLLIQVELGGRKAK